MGLCPEVAAFSKQETFVAVAAVLGECLRAGRHSLVRGVQCSGGADQLPETKPGIDKTVQL